MSTSLLYHAFAIRGHDNRGADPRRLIQNVPFLRVGSVCRATYWLAAAHYTHGAAVTGNLMGGQAVSPSAEMASMPS